MHSSHEAWFYEQRPGNEVLCTLCPHDCHIRDGGRGVCAVRYNHQGRLYTVVYDKVISRHIDPIEKKPFYHFMPGSRSYSIATVGCNLRCAFCQNWSISRNLDGGAVSAERLAGMMLELQDDGCHNINWVTPEHVVAHVDRVEHDPVADEAPVARGQRSEEVDACLEGAPGPHARRSVGRRLDGDEQEVALGAAGREPHLLRVRRRAAGGGEERERG